ncbi:MAG: DUF4440 domain-containing protein [Bacteroidetes bacterium]|nr:DUF4440 domain-containing protein [Bacteroidota bacterium]
MSLLFWGLHLNTTCAQEGLEADLIKDRLNALVHDFNALAAPGVMAAYFTGDAELLDPNGHTDQGREAIGAWFASFHLVARQHLDLKIDEVLEIRGDCAYVRARYTQQMTWYVEGTDTESKGVLITLLRKEQGAWLVLRQVWVKTGEMYKD